MACQPIKDVVATAEGLRFMIGTVGKGTAAEFLVSRLFTDAVFSQDIRAIQLIINRIDGGLPKDTEVDQYRTMFGDTLNEVMSMNRAEQLKILPDDTVMMALCKSLYSIAVEDIYWDYEHGKSVHPSDSKKKERDSALRMVLERTGGRKTLAGVEKEKETVELAGWIAELPENTC